MFTVEFESEDTIITTLDEEGKHEDVELLLDKDGAVWIRQFCGITDEYDLIHMNRNQFLDILAAWNSSEGAYFRKRKRNGKDKS
jgi:hypothetical protein